MNHVRLIKRSITVLVAVIASVTWAGAATAVAQTQVDTDFAGGTHDGTEVAPPGDLVLSREIDVSEEFDGAALPAGWEMSEWNTGGSATVAAGELTIDGARANTTGLYDSGRTLDFAATFTADPFQHMGFGVDFNDAPWAMFSTGGAALPVGLYARTAAPGGPAENTAIAGVDPLVEHDYRIEWTPIEVRYYVDGVLVATHAIAITAQLRPVASDFNLGGGAVQVEYVDLYSYPSSGTFTSRVFDAGDNGATWRTLTAALDAPAGTSVSFETRTGSTPTPDASWSTWQTVGAGGEISSALGRRYLQYRATLSSTDTTLTPSVQSVTLGYEADASAPVVTIGDVTVAGATARITFSSEAGATFECSLDGGAFAACTSPHQYTGLSEGSHTVRVRATDQAGNTGTAAERTFVIDTTAPTVTIGGVTVTGTTAQVTFSSEAGATFQCSLDGGAFAACTSPHQYTGLSGGNHTVRVRATDQAGNVGAAVERSFTVDTTAPVATIAEVAVSGTTARVTFSSEPGATFQCSLDGAAYTACASPHDYTGLSSGSHTVRVRAIDQAGNTGAAAERTFVIDTTAPTVTLADVAVTGATARVTFSSEAGATFQCSLDGGAFAACTSPREYTGLSEGSHTVRVRATDQAGNAGAAVERSFVIDTTAPTVTIADVAVTGTTARVSFSSEAGATFQCSLDGGAFTACTSPREYTGLSGGSHAIRVRAIDQAGNVGAAVERTFVISSPPPPAPTPDTTAPKVRPKPKTVFASNKGRFKVRLRCPSDETRCRIVIRIRYRGKTVASKAVTVPGGSSKTVALKLRTSARAALNRNERLTVTAMTTARDAAGNRATTQTRLRLRA